MVHGKLWHYERYTDTRLSDMPHMSECRWLYWLCVFAQSLGIFGCRNAAFNWWCCGVRVLLSWKMSLGFLHRHTGILAKSAHVGLSDVAISFTMSHGVHHILLAYHTGLSGCRDAGATSMSWYINPMFYCRIVAISTYHGLQYQSASHVGLSISHSFVWHSIYSDVLWLLSAVMSVCRKVLSIICFA